MRRRLTRWGKWAGLAAMLLVLILALAARCWGAHLRTDRLELRCEGRHAPMTWWTASVPADPLQPRWWHHVPVLRSRLIGPGVVNVGAAFYVLHGTMLEAGVAAGLLAGLPTALLWWLDGRSCRAGCRRCGYSRAGLPAGAPYPECGQGAAA